MVKLYDGGKLIAKGSFGCVYKPPLKCINERRRQSGYISKLIHEDDAKDEIKEQGVIDKIDPNYYYHLRLGKVCIPDKPDKQTDDLLKGCVLHKVDLATLVNTDRLKSYRILHIEEGGIGFDKYLEDIVLKKNKSKLKEYEMMLYDFTRLLYGLDVFDLNEIGHFDLKTQNIVYDAVKNRFNYIDFGYTSKYENFVSRFLTSAQKYWVYPTERAFIPHSDSVNIMNFYHPIIKLAIKNLSYDALKQSTEFISLMKTMSSHMVGYRLDLRNISRIDIDEYCLYGFNSALSPSHHMVYDYVRYVQELLEGGTQKVDIPKIFQLEIISKLDIFSMSLVMLEFLYSILKVYDINKVVTNYGGNLSKNKNFKERVEQISPFFAKFYELALKMNVPSFPNRITANRALRVYINEIYIPIKNKYNLPEIDFLDKSPPHTSGVSKRDTSETPLGDRPISPIKLQPLKNDVVFNPLTRRYIKKYGKTAKTLKKRGIIPKTPTPLVKRYSKSKKETTTIKSKKLCPDGKILNPKTNRCISKSGKTYKKLIS